MPASWLEIDCDRLRSNIAALRRVIRGGEEGEAAKAPAICGVVKKNGYGLGAVEVGRHLVRAGVEMLAVYDMAEAEALLRAGVVGGDPNTGQRQACPCPLLVMGPVRRQACGDPLRAYAAAGLLHLTIHHPEQIQEVAAWGRRLGVRWPVHLYVDTGMSRGGLNAAQFEAAVRALGPRAGRMARVRGQVTARAKVRWHEVPATKAASMAKGPGGLRLAGVYSHLATADCDPVFAATQANTFERLLAEPSDAATASPLVRHLANTCGLLRDRRYHLDMVRPGLGLYGYGPESCVGNLLAASAQLQPVLRWVSHVAHVQTYVGGATVGYGCTHRLKRDSVLGLVPVGYGDGYPLALGNRASVRVRPHDAPAFDAPVIGRVNMDQIVVDLTPRRRGLLHAAVELVSPDRAAPHALPRLAELAGTNCYEMLCRLSPALTRRYVTSPHADGASGEPADVDR